MSLWVHPQLNPRRTHAFPLSLSPENFEQGRPPLKYCFIKPILWSIMRVAFLYGATLKM